MSLGSGGADKNAPEQRQKWISPPAPGGMSWVRPALARVAFKAFPPRLEDRLVALTGEPKHRTRFAGLAPPLSQPKPNGASHYTKYANNNRKMSK
jgi:hypothetical protein